MNFRHNTRTVLGTAALLSSLVATASSASAAEPEPSAPSSDLETAITTTAPQEGTPILVRPRQVAYGVPFDCKPSHTTGAAAASAADDDHAADAAAADESIWTRKRLTGDWGGVRTDLHDIGLDFKLWYSQYYQKVTSGGANDGGESGGAADYVLSVDGHKLGLWEGLYLNAHMTSRWGEDVVERTSGFGLPNTGMLYPLPGDYNKTRLTGFFALQMFNDGKAAGLIGKLNAIDLVSMFFPNTIDNGKTGFMNANNTVIATPFLRYIGLSVWGTGLWTVNKEKGLATTGVLALGNESVSTSSRSNLTSGFRDGVTLAGFHREYWDWEEKPGYALVWVSGSTKRYGSLDPSDWIIDSNEGIIDKEGKKPWGIATYLNQVLWQEDAAGKKNVRFFGGLGYSDGNPSPMKFNAFASIEGFGLVKGRPDDRMGFAGFYGTVTNDIKNATASGPDPVRDQWGLEMYYSFQVTPWLHVTPDVQLIRSGLRNQSTTVIIGARAVVDF